MVLNKTEKDCGINHFTYLGNQFLMNVLTTLTFLFLLVHTIGESDACLALGKVSKKAVTKEIGHCADDMSNVKNEGKNSLSVKDMCYDCATGKKKTSPYKYQAAEFYKNCCHARQPFFQSCYKEFKDKGYAIKLPKTIFRSAECPKRTDIILQMSIVTIHALKIFFQK